jgi:hypothetical protein
MEKSAVEWLVEQVNSDCLNSTFIRQDLVEKAREMHEKEMATICSKLVTDCKDLEISEKPINLEISDEEIENDAFERFITDSGRFGFISGARWYREKLKEKHNGK